MSTRILTNREFENGSVEYIDVHSSGVIYWTGIEYAQDGQRLGEAVFPVDLDFVQHKFLECGRELEVARLPANVIANPYRLMAKAGGET